MREPKIVYLRDDLIKKCDELIITSGQSKFAYCVHCDDIEALKCLWRNLDPDGKGIILSFETMRRLLFDVAYYREHISVIKRKR